MCFSRVLNLHFNRYMRKKLTSKQILTLFGMLSGGITLYGVGFYFYHLEKSDITGRTRFIFFDHDQIQKIFEDYVLQVFNYSKTRLNGHLYLNTNLV